MNVPIMIQLRLPAALRANQNKSRSTTLRTNAANPRLAPLQVTYTTNSQHINIDELVDLMGRCAAFSPGHAIHLEEEHRRRDSNSTSPLNAPLQYRFRRRVRRALDNTMVYIAAYASESSLPAHLHHAARGLQSKSSSGSTAASVGNTPPILRDLWRLAPGILPVLGPKVLIGFARANGDAALVATIHDVAVLPELRGRGVGRGLVKRLTEELYLRDIVDVGAVIRPDLEDFFSKCYFGEDTEGSMTMALSAAGAEKWAQEGRQMVQAVINKKRRPRHR